MRGDDTRRSVARDVLTTQRAGRTTSTTLKKQQTPEKQSHENYGIQDNSEKTTEVRTPVPNRVRIHTGPFDAPVQQPVKTVRVSVDVRQRSTMRSVDFG
jgi:hypothetical protein